MSGAALPSPEPASVDTFLGDDLPEVPAMQFTLERSLIAAALDGLGQRARSRPLTPRARDAAHHLDEALRALTEDAREALELVPSPLADSPAR